MKSLVINNVKEELKQQAKNIRKAKLIFKDGQRTGNWELFKTFIITDLGLKYSWCPETVLDSLSFHFRHKHIAYCLILGRTMEEIENKNNPDNLPSQRSIDDYYKRIMTDLQEERDNA
jgi:hypothetical protein